MNTSPVLNPAIASSTDPTQVSNWIKGLILSASSLIIYFASVALHIQLSAGSLNALATGVGMIVGSIWFVYGLAHHAIAVFGRAK